MNANPKTKMVSFRLSPEEYQLYRDACRSRGARNISELARAALQFVLDDDRMTHEEKVRELQDRVRVLSADIDRYATQLTAQRDSVGAGTCGGGE